MKILVRSALATLLVAGSITAAAFPAQRLVSPQAAEPGSMPETPVTPQGAAKPMPSPPAQAEVKLDGKNITVHYNAPSLRGRVMIGDHDPYGKVWRTGANPATSFITEGDIMVGNLRVPAGKYTLYSLPEAPGATPWMLIINKQTGQWGTVYNENQDLGRTPMHYNKLPASQEVMSLSFEKTTGQSTQFHIKWATTDEWVTIKAAR